MKLRLALAATLAISATHALAEPSIKVGSPAPPLKIAKWVKGSAIDSFKPGKVYVVEFWATWCGPCKQSIPHLTEMAKKFAGKVDFVGVDVFEVQNPTDETYFQKVEDFVKDFGDKMDYNVCIDGKEGTMAKTWMTAANQNGIPTAFVIDQKGSIAWIGHPMAGLDKVLDQVIAGTFDSQAYAKKMADDQAAAEKASAKMNAFITPYREGRYADAVAAMDKAFAQDKTLELQFGTLKYQAMAIAGMAGANDYARKLGSGVYKDNSAALNSMAWVMVQDNSPVKKPDYKLAATLAQQAVTAGEKTKDEMLTGYALDTLALAFFRLGDFDKALSNQERALKIVSNLKDGDAATLKEMNDRLALYKSKKG